jgi:hypothetical protein
MQDQLTRRQTQKAGVTGDDGLLQQVLDTDLGDGITMRAFYPTFGGLVPNRVREALGLTWNRADQARFEEWTGAYAEKVLNAPNRPDDWFDVAVKTRRS